MSLRLSGLNPLSYLGVEPYTPPQLTLQDRQPTANDIKNFNLGTLWLMKDDQELWVLINGAGNVATWVQLYPGAGGGATSFPTDSGTANEVGGDLNIFGDGRVTTSGAGNTVSIALTDTVASQYVANIGTATPAAGILNVIGGDNITTEGIGDTLFIDLDGSIILPGTLTLSSLGRGVVQSMLTGELFSNEGTDGQLLISSSSGAPSWANLTSSGGTIDIINGANSINIDINSSGSNAAFLVRLGFSIPNVIGGSIGTFYTLGTDEVCEIITDNGGNIFPGNGLGLPATFTAPITGNYLLNFNVTISSSGGGTGMLSRIITTGVINRTYENHAVLSTGTSFGLKTCNVQVVAPMEAGDVAQFSISASTLAGLGGTSVFTTSNAVPETWFSGYLI